MSVAEGQLLWNPSQETVDQANVTHLMHWLRDQGIVECSDYQQLWRWSVDNTEAFWAAVWRYINVISDSPYDRIVSSLEMKPGNQWFEGSRVNWAEHILRHEVSGKTALYALSESRSLNEVSWTELAAQVRILATRMRNMGVKPGDSVCCLMPNIPETVVAMLASISIGAVWSNAAPEFGVKTILDRFTQVRPKWLFVCDGYQFGAKSFDRRNEISEIVGALQECLQQVVFLPYLDAESAAPVEALNWQDLLGGEDPGRDEFQFQRVPHDHPLWVLFSSGTTGLPKAIVHSHIGALMGMSSCTLFHMDFKPSDVGFFYTTTGWVMFTLLVGMMLSGSSIVLYDGSPAYQEKDILWKLAADTKATYFGASPTFVQMMEQFNISPGSRYDLSSLRGISCSGSPATPESFEWIYQNVKSDAWVSSSSGGTELVGPFVGGVPTLPVYAGEIQYHALGMDVDSWDESGESLIDEVGELVCKTPFPSMPIYFLNDEEGEKYQDAYFNEFPGVWRHGDFIEINQRGGSYIRGRSDATLNRYGVRIGTAELYRTVESMDGVVDSLVVCIELPGGKFFMPLFLQLAPGVTLDKALQEQISSELRTDCSPRHVPDKFYAIDQVPYTLTGKKLEVPVRKLLLGWDQERTVSQDSMKNPESLDYFLNYVKNTKDYSIHGAPS